MRRLFRAASPELEPTTEDGSSLEANLVLLTILGGVIVSSSLETLQHRNHKTWFPESSLAVLAGLLVGVIIRFAVSNPPNNLVFNGEIFFLVALPVLIFDAGYSLRKKEFFGQLFTILTFSIVGTAASAAIIGGILFAAGQQGASLKLDFNEAMAYGGVLSATDAVASAAVLRGYGGVDANLMALVLGEGALNDATSIVWYQVFAGFFKEGITEDSSSDATSLFFTELFGSLFLGLFIAIMGTYFFRVVHMGWLPEARHLTFVFRTPKEYFAARVLELKEEKQRLLLQYTEGGDKLQTERKPFAAAYSAVKGLRESNLGDGKDSDPPQNSETAGDSSPHHSSTDALDGEIARLTQLGKPYLALKDRRGFELKPSSSVFSQTAYIILLSYVAYLLADSLHMSGVVCILFTGIGLNHFMRPLLTREGKEFSEGLVRVLSATADTSVFFQVGLDIALTAGTDRGIDNKGEGEMVGWVFLSIIVSRTLTVFPIAFFVNFFRGEGRKIPWEFVVVLWYSSMRGANSYAFSLVFPSKNQGVLIDLTASVVLISVLVYATSMKYLLNCLGLRQKKHDTLHGEGQPKLFDQAMQPLARQRSGRFLPTEADDSDEEDDTLEEKGGVKLLEGGGAHGGLLMGPLEDGAADLASEPNFQVAVVQGVRVYLPKPPKKNPTMVKRAMTFINSVDSQLRWMVSGVVRE